jgi:hypothetical protein
MIKTRRRSNLENPPANSDARAMTQLAHLMNLLLLSLAACSGTAEVAAWPTEGTAPRPYTAEQIRDAHPDGTVVRFLVQQPGADDLVQVMQFGSNSAEGTMVESWTETRVGARLSPSTSQRAGWEELRDHAAYDAALSARERTPCSTQTGDYECWLYTVRAADESDQRVQYLYFAIDKPGPPVKLLVRIGSDEVFRMEMIEYTRPARQS